MADLSSRISAAVAGSDASSTVQTSSGSSLKTTAKSGF